MANPYPITVIEEHEPEPGLIPVVEQLLSAMVDRAGELEVPPFNLTVVLSGDLAASVAGYGEPDFQPERLGKGVVAGKTLAQVRDFSDVVIVLDAADDVEADAFIIFERICLLTHEYCHALIGRLRAAAGTRPAAPTRIQTPAEAAAILAYEAADEYRCDLFANGVLNLVEISVDNSEPRPVNLEDVFSDSYRSFLVNVLQSTVYPGWPDLVQSYRNYEIELFDMFSKLVTETGHVLNLIAHADATAHASNQPPVLTELATRPAVDLYLGGVWTPLRQILDTTATVPPLAEFADVDNALQACGRGVVDMWDTLGVRGHRIDDDQLYLYVNEPVR